jgi:hypothetical protein
MRFVAIWCRGSGVETFEEASLEAGIKRFQDRIWAVGSIAEAKLYELTSGDSAGEPVVTCVYGQLYDLHGKRIEEEPSPKEAFIQDVRALVAAGHRLGINLDGGDLNAEMDPDGSLSDDAYYTVLLRSGDVRSLREELSGPSVVLWTTTRTDDGDVEDLSKYGRDEDGTGCWYWSEHGVAQDNAHDGGHALLKVSMRAVRVEVVEDYQKKGT